MKLDNPDLNLDVITGLSAYGTTAQTHAIADQLYRDPAALRCLIDELTAYRDPIRYSNEDIDRKSRLASRLAEIARRSVA